MILVKQLTSDDWRCLIKFEMEEGKKNLQVIVTITSRGGDAQFVVARELLWPIAEQLKKADEILQKDKERGDG